MLIVVFHVRVGLAHLGSLGVRMDSHVASEFIRTGETFPTAKVLAHMRFFPRVRANVSSLCTQISVTFVPGSRKGRKMAKDVPDARADRRRVDRGDIGTV